MNDHDQFKTAGLKLYAQTLNGYTCGTCKAKFHGVPPVKACPVCKSGRVVWDLKLWVMCGYEIGGMGRKVIGVYGPFETGDEAKAMAKNIIKLEGDRMREGFNKEIVEKTWDIQERTKHAGKRLHH